MAYLTIFCLGITLKDDMAYLTKCSFNFNQRYGECDQSSLCNYIRVSIFDFEVSFSCSFLDHNFALKLADMISVCFIVNMA